MQAGLFTDLELSQEIQTALRQLNFIHTTPVQNVTIPIFTSHKDVVVEAVTGSGKTLAFLIPILQIIQRKESIQGIQAIIITPTRELAQQIHKVLSEILALMTTEIKEILFIGGTNDTVNKNIQEFQATKPNIIVGTPGRLIALFQRKNLFKMSELEVLILDEADRLLDMGFEKDVKEIIKLIPKQRRTGLFSATMTEGLEDLVKAGLRNPKKIVVKVEGAKGELMVEQRVPSTLVMKYSILGNDEKLSALIKLLTQDYMWMEQLDKKCIVYFATGACVDFYYKIMKSLKLPLELFSLHGKMVSKKRLLTFSSFQQSLKGSVLLCTDVAARGLDIPDIDLVVQYDPPQDPKQYSHRCGRTARIGKAGLAVIFLTEHEDTYVEFLKIRKYHLDELVIPNTNIISGTKGVGSKNDYSKEFVLQHMIDQNLKDRDLMDKSILAFVSFIRSYKEHVASFIFQSSNLNIGQLARSFGLLTLPSMPELRKMKTKNDFVPIELSKIDNIKYQDTIREKKRVQKPKVVKVRKVVKDSWSLSKGKKEKKQERVMKKVKRKAAKIGEKKSGPKSG